MPNLDFTLFRDFVEDRRIDNINVAKIDISRTKRTREAFGLAQWYRIMRTSFDLRSFSSYTSRPYLPPSAGWPITLNRQNPASGPKGVFPNRSTTKLSAQFPNFADG